MSGNSNEPLTSKITAHSGRIALIDDGSSRPGCGEGSNYVGCWSRAVMYELNHTDYTVRLVWQFEDPRSLNGLEAVPAAAVIVREDVAGFGPVKRDNATNAANAAQRSDAANGTNATTAVARSDAATEETVTDPSAYYEEEIVLRDIFNWDGGAVERLASGRVLVAFTSPYDAKGYDTDYAMTAYEVDKDGAAIIAIAVPHGTDQLTHAGAYRFIPWSSIMGEATDPPFPIAR